MACSNASRDSKTKQKVKIKNKLSSAQNLAKANHKLNDQKRVKIGVFYL